MAKLTHLVYDFTTKWTDELMKNNADTLEFIAIGMEQNYYDFPTIDCKFTWLQEMVFTYEYADFLTGHPDFVTILEEYPDVEVRTEKVEFGLYVNAFIKKYGGDQALNIDVI